MVIDFCQTHDNGKSEGLTGIQDPDFHPRVVFRYHRNIHTNQSGLVDQLNREYTYFCSLTKLITVLQQVIKMFHVKHLS